MSISVPSPAPVIPRKRSPLRVVGIGCGSIAVFLLLVVIVFAVMLQSERNKPYNAASEVSGLAGVPIYTGAKIDEGVTRDARAVAVVVRGLTPANSTTAVGLRTSDDPQKVIAFYDAAMAKFGFIKTTLGGGPGEEGASYVLEGITVVIQLKDDPGEDRQLFVIRFDNGPKTALGKRSNVVTPEDFKKAKAAQDKAVPKVKDGSAGPNTSPNPVVKEKAP